MTRIIIIITALLLLAIMVGARQQEYSLNWMSINSGGNMTQSSTNYAAQITVGQPVAGKCQSASYRASLGFWSGRAGIITDISDNDDEDVLPATFELGQNYPNPFNPATVIKYSLTERCHVTLDIYNVLGQKVRTLVDESKPLGQYQIIWDGLDDNGLETAAGVYLYRLKAGNYLVTKKMMFIK